MLRRSWSAAAARISIDSLGSLLLPLTGESPGRTVIRLTDGKVLLHHVSSWYPGTG